MNQYSYVRSRAHSRSLSPVPWMIAFAVSCTGGADSDVNRSYWDSDGDGISTQVEIHIPNAIYHFDTTRVDANPSFPNGTLASGSLSGGINLPDMDYGFYEYRPGSDPIWDHPDSNDWGTLKLINTIEGTGRGWYDFDPTNSSCYYYQQRYDSFPAAAQFGVGDMSKFGGGLWLDYDGSSRHAQHQNGLEVDVRFLRLDHANSPFDLIVDSAAVANGGQSNYDLYGTADLVSCFLNTGAVDSIYADSSLLGFWAPQLSNHPDHHNHFHVVVRYP